MIDNLGPPWKLAKCEGCGTEIKTAPGERYVSSIDGRLWHLGYSPPRTVKAQPRSPVEDDAVERVARAMFEDSVYSSVRWETASDDLKASFRKPARAALSQSPAIDPRVEELVEAARGARHLASLLASEVPTTAQAQDKITRLDTALAAFGGKTE